MAEKQRSKKLSFSRREGEVMDVLFKKRDATAREVWSALGEKRTYATIRKILRILEEKGHVTHRTDGMTFVYSPRMNREAAAESAMERLVDTFFQGSVENAVAGLIQTSTSRLSEEQFDELEKLIEQARKEGR
ncbi:MAG: BlaI/MecI/CopY family transcriptional regulator [Verrucomicrobiota bacterium]